jgi:hypothetical protein
MMQGMSTAAPSSTPAAKTDDRKMRIMDKPWAERLEMYERDLPLLTEAFKKANCHFAVERRPLATDLKNELGDVEYFAVQEGQYRRYPDGANKQLWAVEKSYKSLDHHLALSALEEHVSTGKLSKLEAWSRPRQTKAFGDVPDCHISAKATMPHDPDEARYHIFISTTHDGTQAVRPQLVLEIPGEGMTVAVPMHGDAICHRGDIEERVQVANKVYGSFLSKMGSVHAQIETAKHRMMTNNQIRGMVIDLFGFKKGEEAMDPMEWASKTRTKYQRICDTIGVSSDVSLLISDPTGDDPLAGKSGWEVLRGICRYADRHAKSLSDKVYSSGAKIKLKAWQQITASDETPS